MLRPRHRGWGAGWRGRRLPQPGQGWPPSGAWEGGDDAGANVGLGAVRPVGDTGGRYQPCPTASGPGAPRAWLGSCPPGSWRERGIAKTCRCPGDTTRFLGSGCGPAGCSLVPQPAHPISTGCLRGLRTPQLTPWQQRGEEQSDDKPLGVLWKGVLPVRGLCFDAFLLLRSRWVTTVLSPPCGRSRGDWHPGGPPRNWICAPGQVPFPLGDAVSPAYVAGCVPKQNVPVTATYGTSHPSTD